MDANKNEPDEEIKERCGERASFPSVEYLRKEEIASFCETDADNGGGSSSGGGASLYNVNRSEG